MTTVTMMNKQSKKQKPKTNQKTNQNQKQSKKQKQTFFIPEYSILINKKLKRECPFSKQHRSPF